MRVRILGGGLAGSECALVLAPYEVDGQSAGAMMRGSLERVTRKTDCQLTLCSLFRSRPRDRTRPSGRASGSKKFALIANRWPFATSSAVWFAATTASMSTTRGSMRSR